MNTLSYKTRSAKPGEIEKSWVLVDAQNQVLGRIASRIAFVLRGKHKTNYTPHIECGDHVVVINAGKVRLTGNKMKDKTYFRHSGYPGGETILSAATVLEKDNRRLIEAAVRGMLPKNRIGRRLFTHMHVYGGAEHKHQAQNPQLIELLAK